MACLLFRFAAVLSVHWQPAVQASAFLERAPSSTDALLDGLGKALVRSRRTPEAVEMRVAGLMVAMRPVFKALPRSAEGYLQASAVRYLLHRYFIDHHGWFVPKSFVRDEVANESLPEVILGPGAVATTLSERLAMRGLSLFETSVMAFAVETLASGETAERLHVAYWLADLSHREEHIDESEVMQVIEKYLPLYVLSLDHRTITHAQMKDTLNDIYTTIPTWDKLRKRMREVRAEVVTSDPEQQLSFSGMLSFVEELQHRYGRWQDSECSSVKQALLQYATPGTGRVPLQIFHTASLPGGWKTDELDLELRQMGALDETDPSQPSVVVPNYFDTTTNCEEPSKYYSVCCISACEGLLKHLEQTLGSPNAPPSRIVEIVERLPSATVQAPRALRMQLKQRLDSIAAVHGGHVPLHGRLFRQWMHHAYPSDCSFPFLLNDAPPKSVAQPAASNATVAAKSGVRNETVQLLGSAAEDAGAASAPDDVDLPLDIPWFDKEELFIVFSAALEESAIAPDRGTVRDAMLLLLACCMAARLVMMFPPAALVMGWLPQSVIGLLTRTPKLLTARKRAL